MDFFYSIVHLCLEPWLPQTQTVDLIKHSLIKHIFCPQINGWMCLRIIFWVTLPNPLTHHTHDRLWAAEDQPQSIDLKQFRGLGALLKPTTAVGEPWDIDFSDFQSCSWWVYLVSLSSNTNKHCAEDICLYYKIPLTGMRNKDMFSPLFALSFSHFSPCRHSTIY